MKYRVKRIEWEEYTWYIPQKKSRFFWKNYYKDNGKGWDYGATISFHTEEKAWEYIRNHKPWPITTYTYSTHFTETECCNGDCNQGRTCPKRL